MKRIQIHIDEHLDRAAAAEARRRGMSKAALIRASLKRELNVRPPGSDGMWGTLPARPEARSIEDVDETLYGPVS
ncbi:MAG: ribbon-helix-helix protein, CopG family [Actinomycetota bacterium]